MGSDRMGCGMGWGRVRAGRGGVEWSAIRRACPLGFVVYFTVTLEKRLLRNPAYLVNDERGGGDHMTTFRGTNPLLRRGFNASCKGYILKRYGSVILVEC